MYMYIYIKGRGVGVRYSKEKFEKNHVESQEPGFTYRDPVETLPSLSGT